MNNELFKNYFTDYRSPSNMYKKLRKAEGKKMKTSTFNQKSLK